MKPLFTLTRKLILIGIIAISFFITSYLHLYTKVYDNRQLIESNNQLIQQINYEKDNKSK